MLLAVGRSQSPFARRVTLHTAFRDTAGLTVGAAVRIGGVDVGTVEAIDFAPQLGVKEVSVRLRVQARYLSRIRADSRAMLTPKGLLGDMTVTINVGSASAAPVAAGGFIPGVEQQRIVEMVSSAYEGIDEVRSLSRSVREHVDALMTPEVIRDVGRIIAATADAAEEVQKGDGLAHALIYDRALARDARSAGRDASRAAATLASAIGRIDRVAAAIEDGPGSLHRLAYDDDLGPLFEDARRGAGELADVVAAVRRGEGPLGKLAFGREGEKLVADLATLSRTLRGMVADAAAGKGTIGALLEDPTVYEDLKLILRDVKRSTMLKALVRFTIERDRLHR
jgi:phospholipid/cholesterol/gamma-HCH transport system substrate-binding protein